MSEGCVGFDRRVARLMLADKTALVDADVAGTLAAEGGESEAPPPELVPAADPLRDLLRL